MECGGKSATGGATPLWLRRMARATHSSQSGVAIPPAGLDAAAPQAADDGHGLTKEPDLERDNFQEAHA